MMSSQILGGPNLPSGQFGQLNAPVQGAAIQNAGNIDQTYGALGLRGPGGSISTAEATDLGNVSEFADATTYQELQRFAAAQNAANQGQGKGTSGFPAGFNGGSGFSSGFDPASV
jgi:hypothetical protein